MDKIKAIVEIPRDSYYKYELKNGQLVLDRQLSYPIPDNYGYIKNTLALDGDSLDVFIVESYPIISGTEVCIDILGGLDCTDNGVKDEKLIGILHNQKSIFDIHSNIKKFLSKYKQGFTVNKELSKEECLELIKKYSI